MRALKGILFAIASLVLVPAAAYAQASIAGVVRDTTGAVLPGVTVEAASPALIEKVRSVVTDGTGQFKIVDLRPGTYSVTFTLPGFNTFKRDGIELAGTFTATVNADMRVGSLEETVTVTGEASVVDVQSVTQQVTLGKEVLDAIPAGRNQHNFANLIPGMTGPLDYGGQNNLNLNTITVHGSRADDQRVMVDGMSISATSGNGQLSNFIPDMTSTQEVAVSYSAGNAEQAFGGVQMNLIPREGGNQFKGSFFATAANESWQSDNFTDELKDAGLRTPNSLKVVYDMNPGAGGPLVKDKLWFYSAARWQTTQSYIAGLYENKNAGDPTKWSLRAGSRPPGLPAADPEKLQHAPDVATQPAEQDRRVRRASISRLGAADAHPLVRVGHEIRLPGERVLHRQLYVDDQQQMAVRCEGLGHRPGLEGPLPERRLQPRVHGAASGCVQGSDRGDRARWSHPRPALSGCGPDRSGTVHPCERVYCLGPGVGLVHHGRPCSEVRLSRYVRHAPGGLQQHPGQRPLPLQQWGPEPDHRNRDALRLPEQSGRGARGLCAGQVDARPAHAQSGRALRLLEYQFPRTVASGPAGSCPIGTSRFRRTTTWAGRIFPRGSAPSTTCSATERRPSRSTWAGTSLRSV